MPTLQEKIQTKSACVGIIGLGYVGLPLLHAFCESGFGVIGFDTDDQKISSLKAGVNYLNHLGKGMVQQMLDSGRFQATCDMSQLRQADVILICVPTPLDTHFQPDLSFVQNAGQDIATSLRPGQLIVLESSTYPGTTRQILLPTLQETGLTLGQDFFLAYSPEREDPGRKDHNTRTIPKLVGGVDAESGKLASDLYRHAIKTVIPVETCEIAEASKLLENIYRAVNIALVNEMKVLLTAMDIDIWQVIDAAATKPFGFSPFYPGPGLGGHCIPIDPYYLTWKAKEFGKTTRFIELAGEVNRAMPEYVVSRTMLALNQQSKSVKGASILLLGLAYKPNVDDIRESPTFELIEKLQALGAMVSYNDPHVPSTHKMRHHDLQMQSVGADAASLAQYDCVIIATHHDAYDWQEIANSCQLIVDTRGVLRLITGKKDHIFQA